MQRNAWCELPGVAGEAMTHQSVFIGLSGAGQQVNLVPQEREGQLAGGAEDLRVCQFAVAKPDGLLVGPEGQELLVPQGLERRLVEGNDGLVVGRGDGELRVVDHFGGDILVGITGWCCKYWFFSGCVELEILEVHVS